MLIRTIRMNRSFFLRTRGRVAVRVGWKEETKSFFFKFWLSKMQLFGAMHFLLFLFIYLLDPP